YCYPIIFGGYESVQLRWNLFIIRNIALASIGLFLFIYFFIIFLNRKNERYYLNFSMLALSLGAWIVGYEGVIFFLIDSQMAYVISTYIGSIVASLSYVSFIAHFFNISKRERAVSCALTILLLALIPAILLEMAMRGNIYYYQKYLYNLFMVIVVFVVTFCMYICVLAVKKRQPYARRILLGVSVYTASFMLSIPIFFSIFTTVPFLIIGFFIMTVIFATVLASRFAQVHNDLESLNISLTEINHEKDMAIENLNIYKYIVSESRDHMAFVDAEGRFVEANNALLKAYDRVRAEVVNRTVGSIFGEDEYETAMKEYFDACFSGEQMIFERWQDFPLAGRRYMITSLLPYMVGSEQKTGIVYYSMDITDRIMFEQELVKISENERNAIGIELHDNLAQKLFGIALKSSVLAGDVIGGQQRAALEIEGLINEAIAYVRNMAKSLTRIDFIDGGFVSLLNELKGLMEQRYQVTLSVDVDCDIDMINRIYYSQIYYIMQEAVMNSVKHSGANVIHVRVHRSGDDIRMVIKDDGVGIPDSADRGRGIGLKIMKYRARMIGSSISIQRGAEGGTEVVCTIPA
ncbi:MAG: PAS domain S-box protein, partial [Spirochaetes bacterium]|nr:PAS domain S-box protein [Spirochaetota bacterium]